MTTTQTISREQLLSDIAHAEEKANTLCGACAEDHARLAGYMRMLLAALDSEPVAWSVGGIATHDKKLAERRSEEDNLLMEPLYRHPIITGIDENHYDPELEPGLYVAEIMTKGGAAIINGYYTAPPAPVAVPDEVRNGLKAQGIEEVLKDAKDYAPLTAGQWETLTNNWHQTFIGLADRYAELDACRAAMLNSATGLAPGVMYDPRPATAGSSMQAEPVTVPDGWKLVPVEPTKDMLRAGQSVVGFWLNTVHCYVAMLAAAPSAPEQEV